ncbi:MAG TPA: hypothetical protein VFL41_02140 [Gaiellaceae bacterium]|nr:hypothetical protein [Gaiellaceae bacterium]HET8653047.1 hypothetical protein [Gaiellaceae bacterium]
MAFFYMGGMALVVGIVAAFLVATPARRGWLLVGFGGLLMLASFAFEWSQASNGRDARGCHDCEMFLGRYWQWYLVLFFGLLNWFAWSLGIALGAGERAWLGAHKELQRQRRAPVG